MSLQEQLFEQRQRPTIYPPLAAFGARSGDGLLGNSSVQIPTRFAGVELVTEFVYDLPGEALGPANAESAEMAWLLQNAQQLEQHKGEWLLIRGRQLLVHSRDFAAVRAAIREQQIGSPFVYYVPTDEESNSVTI